MFVRHLGLSKRKLRSLAQLKWKPAPTKAPQRAFSTLFSQPNHKEADAEERDTVLNTMLYLLRPKVGQEHGLNNREDGFVSVKRLLNHPEFRSLDMKRLQNMVLNDDTHRFELTFDPSKGEDSWWLRALRFDEAHWVMKPVFKRDHPGAAVYPTTLKEWNSHISRNGIPRNGRDWIEITRGISTDEYLDSLNDDEQLFIFLNIPKCIEGGLRFYSPTPTTQSWVEYTPLLTKGDFAGYIPPWLFQAVEIVRSKKKLIWGNPKPILFRDWQEVNMDPAEYNEDRTRRTLLKPVDGVGGFYDLRSLEDSSSGISVKKRKGLAAEARKMLARR